MHLTFFAQKVNYNEALGGELVQVNLYEHADSEIDYTKKKIEMPAPTIGITISANYDFPPYDTLVEWCDGEEYDGREKIKEVHLTESSLKMVLENNFSFDISFKTDKNTYQIRICRACRDISHC